MSFISFIISQAKSCFSILIKFKLFLSFFFFFKRSFDTSWQKYKLKGKNYSFRTGETVEMVLS